MSVVLMVLGPVRPFFPQGQALFSSVAVIGAPVRVFFSHEQSPVPHRSAIVSSSRYLFFDRPRSIFLFAIPGDFGSPVKRQYQS
jgi:hypothetical protein